MTCFYNFMQRLKQRVSPYWWSFVHVKAQPEWNHKCRLHFRFHPATALINEWNRQNTFMEWIQRQRQRWRQWEEPVASHRQRCRVPVWIMNFQRRNVSKKPVLLAGISRLSLPLTWLYPVPPFHCRHAPNWASPWLRHAAPSEDELTNRARAVTWISWCPTQRGHGLNLRTATL